MQTKDIRILFKSISFLQLHFRSSPWNLMHFFFLFFNFIYHLTTFIITKEAEDPRGGTASSAQPSSLGVDSPARTPRSGSPVPGSTSASLAPPSPRLTPSTLKRKDSDFLTPRLGSQGRVDECLVVLVWRGHRLLVYALLVIFALRVIISSLVNKLSLQHKDAGHLIFFLFFYNSVVNT